VKRLGARGVVVVMLLPAGLPSQDLSRCRELGVTMHLTKPFKPSELLQALLRALSSPGAAARASEAKSHQTAAGRRLRILLAEDNRVNQRLAIIHLERLGHQVEVAANGKIALAALQGHSFDLLLSDVQMPEMDGFELTAAVRANETVGGKRLPIVAMTAHAMKGDRERCLEAGMDGYIAKPIQARELEQMIDRLFPRADGGTGSTGPKGGSSALATASPTPEDVLDAAGALKRVEGSRDMLKILVEMYFEEAPKQLAAVREAVNRRDAHELERAAHTFKGSVGMFQANASFEVALKLEQMGRAAVWDGVEELLSRLEAEATRLQPALAELIR
jgi:CheY-like chemotaxis protein